MQLFRYKKNPILEANGLNQWESGAVFNCGTTITDDGNVVMLYRAVPSGYETSPSGRGYVNYISSIGYATSKDGCNFQRYEKPVITPSEEWDIYGCEDPRVTRFLEDGIEIYLITYTALSSPAFSGKGDRVALASTHDFKTFTKHGVIIPGLNDKDAVIFPEKIKEKIVMFHRVVPNIQAVYFNSIDELMNPDESFWQKYRTSLNQHVVLERSFEWESEKIGAGPPPIKTAEGWLLIYHGVDGKKVYRTGVALLDLEDPSRVISRSPHPVLEPEVEYERYGDVNNVVFPEGVVVLNDMLFVYYGAADKCCCLATVKIQDLLDYLKEFKRSSL